jgi:hypothetical protein
MNAALLILFVAIQVADVWTTKRAFQLGGEEAMPFGRFLFARLGFWPAALLLKGTIIAIAAVAAVFVSNAYWFTGPLCLGGLYVLLHNWRFIREARKG